MDAFDSVFAGKGVTSSIRRKLDTGVTRSVRLTSIPAGFTLAEFADAAAHGATFRKSGTDQGATLGQSVTISGAAARAAALACGTSAEQTPPPAPTPDPVRKRSAPVGTNGAAH